MYLSTAAAPLLTLWCSWGWEISEVVRVALISSRRTQSSYSETWHDHLMGITALLQFTVFSLFTGTAVMTVIGFTLSPFMHWDNAIINTSPDELIYYFFNIYRCYLVIAVFICCLMFIFHPIFCDSLDESLQQSKGKHNFTCLALSCLLSSSAKHLS